MFLFGFLIEKSIVRTILSRKGTAIHVVLATIGISIAMQNLAAIIWTSEIQQFPPIFAVEYLEWGIVKVAPESISGIVVGLVSMVLLHLFMNYTKLGTAMRAAAQDSNAAAVCGINVSFAKGLSWAISSGLAGICGIIIGPVYGVYMLMGALLGLKGFAAAVIGGYGNMYGAILGGIIIGVIETMAAGYLSSTYKDFIAFFVFIVFLVVKPSGIFNEKIIES
jgi:branched-chain amino acid transport system permease protein